MKGKKNPFTFNLDLENTYSKALTVMMLPSQYRAIEKRARRRRTSKTQIVREAIDSYLAEIDIKENTTKGNTKNNA